MGELMIHGGFTVRGSRVGQTQLELVQIQEWDFTEYTMVTEFQDKKKYIKRTCITKFFGKKRLIISMSHFFLLQQFFYSF